MVLARLAFTPPEPGTYELEISGGGALTQITIWVSGEGQVAWPSLPNQQLTLTPDRQAYTPGDTAKIFIPNPLGEGAQALVTVERGEVLRHQVLEMNGNGYTLNLPLGSDDAPNVYLAVTLIGPGSQGKYDFRQGYLNLEVEPVEQTLTGKFDTLNRRMPARRTKLASPYALQMLLGIPYRVSFRWPSSIKRFYLWQIPLRLELWMLFMVPNRWACVPDFHWLLMPTVLWICRVVWAAVVAVMLCHPPCVNRSTIRPIGMLRSLQMPPVKPLFPWLCPIT